MRGFDQMIVSHGNHGLESNGRGGLTEVWMREETTAFPGMYLRRDQDDRVKTKTEVNTQRDASDQ